MINSFASLSIDLLRKRKANHYLTSKGPKRYRDSISGVRNNLSSSADIIDGELPVRILVVNISHEQEALPRASPERESERRK